MSSTQAIGVFDSGVGGLSVLREISAQLPNEPLIYLADTACTPYGEKSKEIVQALSLIACHWLVKQNVKALVIACNTATASAIDAIRTCYPDHLVIGVEPGLKPALTRSKTGVIGVLATQNTLNSIKFKRLVKTLRYQSPKTRFIFQAGEGLALLVEQGKAHSKACESLLSTYLLPMMEQGADTLVLGCTHYPFLVDAIHHIAGSRLQLIDTSEAVAQHLKHKLTERGLLNTTALPSTPYFVSSSSPTHLAEMVKKLLYLSVQAHAMQSLSDPPL
ncbi:MAG: glutamate racemase [Ottowia sp.]|nr:glutamate racemase [Ottowia sp.]